MERINNKSINKNMFINGLNGLLNVIFPIISFPYIARILGVVNVGKFNYSSSIIEYFALIAALGINGYAVREGALIRREQKIFRNFCNEVFTLNVISTVISYVILFTVVFVNDGLSSYKSLIIVLSIRIVMTTLGVEWIYYINDDYLTIAMRNIISKILSIGLMLIFVKNEYDLMIYAVVSVISVSLVYLWDFFKAKRVFDVSITKMVIFIGILNP